MQSTVLALMTKDLNVDVFKHAAASADKDTVRISERENPVSENSFDAGRGAQSSKTVTTATDCRSPISWPSVTSKVIWSETSVPASVLLRS